MNILVTGGAGYIGSHVCKALAAAGYVPVVFDNLSTGHRSAVKWGPLVESNLNDMRAIEDALTAYEISAVVHLAGSTSVAESMRNPGWHFKNNVVNTLNLLDAMGAKDIIFSSTAAVYGDSAIMPIIEAYPKVSTNPYGESKLAVERILPWYAKAHGIRFIGLRYFNAAGADPDGELGEDHDPETHLIPLVVRAALNQTPIKIFGTDYPTPDGTAIRDYVHVWDIAEAHVQALGGLDANAGSFFNLGGGRGYSVRQVIAAVEHVSGRKVPIIEAERRPGDPPVLVADAGLARIKLEWGPSYDLETMVKHTLRWEASK